MRSRWMFVCAMLVGVSAMCFAKADGSWLKKVPQADRERMNPFAGNPDAISAGRSLFAVNCAKCHGDQAQGRASRPPLRSERIHDASDGEIAWLLKNGEVFKGMPRWAGLPDQERWQIVAYIRSLNTLTPGAQK